MNKLTIKTVEKILRLIADKRYDELYKCDVNKELSPEDIQYAINEYGGGVTFIPIPLINIEIYKQEGVEYKNTLFLDILLWIDNAESDLTLKCTLFTDRRNKDGYEFAVTDMAVM